MHSRHPAAATPTLLLALLLLIACGGDEPDDSGSTGESGSPPSEASRQDDSEDSEGEWEDEESWAFEGQVIDLLREEPVSDAEVIFGNDFIQGVDSVATLSDEDGYFYVEVASLGETGYFAQVKHPDYDSRNVYTYEVLEKSRPERLIMGDGIQAQSINGRFHGEDGFTTNVDLYVFPVTLTDEERMERGNAMRRLRGGGGP